MFTVIRVRTYVPEEILHIRGDRLTSDCKAARRRHTVLLRNLCYQTICVNPLPEKNLPGYRNRRKHRFPGFTKSSQTRPFFRLCHGSFRPFPAVCVEQTYTLILLIGKSTLFLNLIELNSIGGRLKQKRLICFLG